MIKSRFILIQMVNTFANQIVAMNKDLVKEGEMPKSLKDKDFLVEYLNDGCEIEGGEAVQIAEEIATLAPAPLVWVDIAF